MNDDVLESIFMRELYLCELRRRIVQTSPTHSDLHFGP